MKLMIVCILLLGVASLSIQSPIVDNNADQLVLVVPDSEASSDDDLQVAENHIFRPFFRYKERRAFRRRAREATPEDFAEELPQLPNEDIDDLQPAENHIFRPFFRYEQNRAFRRRAPRDTNQDAPNNVSSKSRTRRSVNNNGDDDLETAEIHIFRPLFRYRQTAAFRRHLKFRNINRRRG